MHACVVVSRWVDVRVVYRYGVYRLWDLLMLLLAPLCGARGFYRDAATVVRFVKSVDDDGRGDFRFRFYAFAFAAVELESRGVDGAATWQGFVVWDSADPIGFEALEEGSFCRSLGCFFGAALDGDALRALLLAFLALRWAFRKDLGGVLRVGWCNMFVTLNGVPPVLAKFLEGFEIFELDVCESSIRLWALPMFAEGEVVMDLYHSQS